MEFKDRIRSLRKEAHMTTTALAAELNKSDTAIRMWETGKSKPDADTLIRLVSLFKCSADYLLGLSDFKSRESWQELTSTESGIQKRLLHFSGRGQFLDSIDNLLSRLEEIDDNRTREDALGLITELLNSCGEQARKCSEIRHADEVKHDAYVDFLGLHENCCFSLLGYRNRLKHAACTINKKETPFGAWLNRIREQTED